MLWQLNLSGRNNTLSGETFHHMKARTMTTGNRLSAALRYMARSIRTITGDDISRLLHLIDYAGGNVRRSARLLRSRRPDLAPDIRAAVADLESEFLLA